MKKIIVTTTINPPTEAIEKYDHMEGWELVVVGDKKTPRDYPLDNGVYLCPEHQENIDKELSDAIGWNCIQRRNFGFIYAYEEGADIIATIDDDNIPLDNWGYTHIGDRLLVNFYKTKQEVFDPISVTNHPELWHRGFPLQLISQRQSVNTYSSEIIVPDIQANFWNGDPDIDAICRMIYSPHCFFNKGVFPFTSNKISPFNSQNTILSKEVLPFYFVFPHVGRMDDIWASYFVQAMGFKVVYDIPTVHQERNVHDYIVDMKKEYIGYEHNLELIRDIDIHPNNIFNFMPEKSKIAYELYREHFK